MPSNSNLISLSSFVYGQFTFIILYRKCNLQCRNQSSNRFARSSTSNLMLAPSLHSLEKSIALQNFCNFQQMRNFLGIICNETHRKQWRYSSAYRLRYCHIGRFSNFLTHWLVNACGCMGVSVFCICVCVCENLKLKKPKLDDILISGWLAWMVEVHQKSILMAISVMKSLKHWFGQFGCTQQSIASINLPPHWERFSFSQRENVLKSGHINFECMCAQRAIKSIESIKLLVYLQ